MKYAILQKKKEIKWNMLYCSSRFSTTTVNQYQYQYQYFIYPRNVKELIDLVQNTDVPYAHTVTTFYLRDFSAAAACSSDNITKCTHVGKRSSGITLAATRPLNSLARARGRAS